MAGKVCDFCGHTFSSRFNRLRHQQESHGEVDIDIYTGKEQDLETLADDDQQEIDEDNAQEEEDDAGAAVHDQEDEEENESGSESENEDDVTESPWRQIIAEACDNAAIKIDTAESVLLEPFLSEFVEAMKTAAEERFSFVRDMEQDSDYILINDTIEKHEVNEGYEKEEAIDAAWHARRFLVKRMVKDNIDLVEDWMKNKSEEDTGEDEEDDVTRIKQLNPSKGPKYF